ncbi:MULTISPECIES: hypothetical protein [unclassified Mesorhizobium]|uniref:hypothetical protein n=1 Tax=unclassified Mesorhizobium TaxID=325217 RepID=UPI000FCAB469|nr:MULTISPECIES: hypothetical protein [unclassified Mesorhizobium]RUZ82645.1 hypothetical protein EN947_17330 [Mesorhizobium sp. M7A.F.Ca.US.003.02.2.1]RUY94731.1 hypothetical protein EN974_23175 [Mesorhizobium sp. M7A.F.Ca.CA.001.12.2.1]RUZ27469.1 hypothetical protein EN949_09625 [Mesorhizobium sp. M7A.F.Ca.US.007.01.2.1]RUZ44974.1 hypothetical protein EN948_21070 [Mesorhizobium sp. M7A.F.Ca.US.003.02.1.1]RUZ66777.1 hypothetical protein EN950_11080 [Mesorhizobium sp. M7A.F.Ca.US.007.01.1.1]
MNHYRAGIEHQTSADAVTLFAVFSRFEFALKRGGFLKGVVSKAAHPDWEKFSRALGTVFFAAMRKAPQADIFFSDQPKSLTVIAANEVAFTKPATVVNLQMLFEAVRLVRNNLFHGEKVYVGPRDQALIAASLFVLDSAMNACSTTAGCEAVPYAFVFAELKGGG